MPLSRSTTKTIKLLMIGTIFGFILANLLIFVDSFLLSQNPETFLLKYKERVRSDDTQLDILKSRTRNKNSREIHSRNTKVRVLCWIMTTHWNHETNARAIQMTWGKRCDTILFFSSQEGKSFPTIRLDSVENIYQPNVWSKTRQALRYVWQNYANQADWFLKVDDDTFVVMENLRFILSAYNSSDAFILGHTTMDNTIRSIHTLSHSYALSREAIRRLVERGLNDSSKCRTAAGGHENIEISECLAHLNVKTINTLDAFGRPQFLPNALNDILAKSSLTHHLNRKIPNTRLKLFRNVFDCCSHTAVSFHNLSYTKMYRYNYFIYHVRIPSGIRNKNISSDYLKKKEIF